MSTALRWVGNGFYGIGIFAYFVFWIATVAWLSDVSFGTEFVKVFLTDYLL